MGSEVSNAPERIWAEDWSGSWNDDTGVLGFDRDNDHDCKYVRADLHADLLRAADELADAFECTLDGGGIVGRGWAMKCRSALSAYKKAKEKLG